MLYFSKLFIPDAFFAFTHKNKKCALLHPLELERAKLYADFDVCYDYSEIAKKIGLDSVCHVLKALFDKLKISKLIVPANFPALMLEKLRSLKLDIEISEGDILPERAIKKDYEASEIAKANNVASLCYKRIVEILASSKISGKKLLWNKKILTSQMVKFELDKIGLEKGATLSRTIFACGDQACDPHCEGFGAVYANSLIVADIFPRLNTSGYFGDMTRTFLKGAPSTIQEHLVSTVLKAQRNAISQIKDGVEANLVHGNVKIFFETQGYYTAQKNGVWGGFFHSTGHGVGLEIHEAPRLGNAKNVLKSGNVVTVEPALYYKGLGACRIEDCVLVENSGAKKLSKFNYDWVISR